MKLLEAPAHDESGRAQPRSAAGAELGPGSLQRSGDGGKGLGPGEGLQRGGPGEQKYSFFHHLLLTSSQLSKPSFHASSSGQLSRVSSSLLCCPLPLEPHRLQLCIVWRYTHSRGLCMGGGGALLTPGCGHSLGSLVGGTVLGAKWNHPQPTRTEHSVKVVTVTSMSTWAVQESAPDGQGTQGPTGKACVTLMQCQALSWWIWGAQGQPQNRGALRTPPARELGLLLDGWGQGTSQAHRPPELPTRAAGSQTGLRKRGSPGSPQTRSPQCTWPPAPAAAASGPPSGGPQAEPQEASRCACTIRGPFTFL